MTYHLVVLLAALLIDRVIGDPVGLWRKLPHPVVLFGFLIDRLDRRFNLPDEDSAVRRRNGILSILGLIALCLAVGTLVATVLRSAGLFGLVLESIVVSLFLAQKSLADHVGAVAVALRASLPEGRKAVAHIVGRDPETLDASGVARAAIESLAENFSDGVVAPALWYGLFGLPGLLTYKMINTADSMIGHRNVRHEDFGFAAARIDDLVNWPAARLSALVIAMAVSLAGSLSQARRAIEAVFRDAGLHRSPNAGWPEAAMAACLDLALAGPRSYDGFRVSEPYINACGRTDAKAGDIDSALVVYWRSCTVITGITAIGVVVAFVC